MANKALMFLRKMDIVHTIAKWINGRNRNKKVFISYKKILIVVMVIIDFFVLLK